MEGSEYQNNFLSFSFEFRDLNLSHFDPFRSRKKAYEEIKKAGEMF